MYWYLTIIRPEDDWKEKLSIRIFTHYQYFHNVIHDENDQNWSARREKN